MDYKREYKHDIYIKTPPITKDLSSPNFALIEAVEEEIRKINLVEDAEYCTLSGDLNIFCFDGVDLDEVCNKSIEILERNTKHPKLINLLAAKKELNQARAKVEELEKILGE